MRTSKPGRKASPVGHNTPSARAREAIAEALCSEVQSWQLPQAKAAARLGIHRTNLNRLLQGELSRFALGHLIDMADVAGIEVELTVRDRLARTFAYVAPQTDSGLFEQAPRDRSKALYAASRALETGGVD